MALGFAGRRVEAERWFQRALTLGEEMGAPSATAFAWMVLAESLEQYGAYTRADDAAQHGLKIAREIEHREWTLATLGPIGRVRRARGDLTGGLICHEEMLATAREVGSAIWMVEALANVAFDRWELGNVETARAASDEALALGSQYQKGNYYARVTQISLLLRAGQPEDALAATRSLRELAAQFRARLPEVWRLEGEALATLGQLEAAEAAYRAGLAAARAVDAAPGLWQVAKALGGLLEQTGRVDETTILRAGVDTELDVLAVTLGEPGLRETLATQR